MIKQNHQKKSAKPGLSVEFWNRQVEEVLPNGGQKSTELGPFLGVC